MKTIKADLGPVSGPRLSYESLTDHELIQHVQDNLAPGSLAYLLALRLDEALYELESTAKDFCGGLPNDR